MSGLVCPHCAEPLDLNVEAVLPDHTDLTLTLSVEQGQFVRLDTIAGVLAEWRKLQIVVGESMGAETEVFLADMKCVDGNLSFTTRIVNRPESAAA